MITSFEIASDALLTHQNPLPMLRLVKRGLIEDTRALSNGSTVKQSLLREKCCQVYQYY